MQWKGIEQLLHFSRKASSVFCTWYTQLDNEDSILEGDALVKAYKIQLFQ